MLFNKNNSGYLTKNEFLYGMGNLFTHNFEYLSKFIFDFFDSDNNGFINKEDVRLIFSYIPLIKDKYSFAYKFRLEEPTFAEQLMSQEEISNILSNMFKKPNMDFELFLYYITKVNIDPFIYPLITLYHYKPFNKEIIQYYSKFSTTKSFINLNDYDINKHVSTKKKLDKIKITNKDKETPIPNLNLKLLPSEILLESEYLKKYISKKELNKLEIQYKPKTVHIPFSIQLMKNIELEKKNKKKNEEDHILGVNIENVNEQKDNDDYILKNIKENETEIENKKLYNSSDLKTDGCLTYEGIIIKLTNLKKLKHVYAKIIANIIFFYEINKQDKKHKSKYNLNLSYLKINGLVYINEKKYYNFILVFPKKNKSYYLESEEIYNNWIELIKKAINYKEIDEYEIKEKIGIGKYGLVRRGIHKLTRRKVAIKFINKKEMTLQERQLLFTEIEILCCIRHPNVLNAYDYIDYSDTCYIITEYIPGGDLYTFLENRDYKLTESYTVNIVQQICCALFYLNTLGILHRDIKPEHILLNENYEKPIAKLIDFGLSDFIFPNELKNETYGTIGYIAPEILEEKFYNKSCDIWSIGVLSYLLLVACLPFDDDHSEEEIKRMTIEEQVPFPLQIWKKRSKEGLFFVENVLRKDPNQRLNIKQILELPWFDKYSKAKLPGNRIRYKGDKIFWYYMLYDEQQVKEYKDEINKILEK